MSGKPMRKMLRCRNFLVYKWTSVFGKGNLMRENESDKSYLLSFKAVTSKNLN